MSDRRAAAVAVLQDNLGYQFRDPELLERALTHASVGDGAKTVRHNERLEFLGDRVLGLLAADYLVASDGEAREGMLSNRHARLVNGRTCAAIARKLHLGEALRLAASETKTGGREKDNILGDACEAVMAAVYLDGGLDPARTVFRRLWADELSDLGRHADGKDPKTALQEWAQGRGLGLPTYRVLNREGPDHAPRFTVQAVIHSLEPETAEGGSRREAEKAAALGLLQRETAT